MSEGTHETGSERAASPRVLVVDDDMRLGRLLVRLLQEEGFAIESAATVTAALALLRARAFDILLCDRRLPDGNGCDLMRAARQMRPIKGIALSGLARDEDIRESESAGFVAHLSKPAIIEDVVAAIRRVLEADAPGPSHTS
jgi:two-component system, chemotaxis family, CheB/CheR fusion protein